MGALSPSTPSQLISSSRAAKAASLGLAAAMEGMPLTLPLTKAKGASALAQARTERRLMTGALCCFLAALLGLGALYAHLLPRMEAHGGEARIPRNVEDIKSLLAVLERWSTTAPGEVLSLFCATYVFMMAFAIPGSIALSVLAGALFGFVRGMALVVGCCIVGACTCYAVSMAIGKPLATWLWPVKMRLFQEEVAKRRNRLLLYMCFIRVTPAFPNVFVNVAAPIVGIPFDIFFFTTLLGLFVTQSVPVKGGLEIASISSLSEIYSRSLPIMCLLSLVLLAPLLLPLLLKERGKKKDKAETSAGGAEKGNRGIFSGLRASWKRSRDRRKRKEDSEPVEASV